ncbi:hypothetical protein Cycma_0782 [Cyclobacterium marinum DSM 745]|uniref:Uncharacterized protein n=1 Tax=Cyclobacterium marinum (strain ATCC 25205 / DSM 745 / LMG 13164 / NCIMB 1802) TaxID=880070 RepID=G0J247_CYCMS|nr:hypothetical protein Cycma_0782 [Cyclobacterium marinum DSM 745]
MQGFKEKIFIKILFFVFKIHFYGFKIENLEEN